MKISVHYENEGALWKYQFIMKICVYYENMSALWTCFDQAFTRNMAKQSSVTVSCEPL